MAICGEAHAGIFSQRLPLEATYCRPCGARTVSVRAPTLGGSPTWRLRNPRQAGLPTTAPSDSWGSLGTIGVRTSDVLNQAERSREREFPIPIASTQNFCGKLVAISCRQEIA